MERKGRALLFSSLAVISLCFAFLFFAFFIAPIFLFYERETAGFSQSWEEHSVPGCSQTDGGEEEGGSGPVILGEELWLKRIGLESRAVQRLAEGGRDKHLLFSFSAQNFPDTVGYCVALTASGWSWSELHCWCCLVIMAAKTRKQGKHEFLSLSVRAFSPKQPRC